MAGVSMTVVPENQLSVISRIVAELSGKKVNFLVSSRKLGGEKKILKFCNRELKGPLLINGNQFKIGFLPAGGVVWDLNTEKVTVEFDPNGDIVLSRIFLNTNRSKILRITVNPI